MTGKQRAYLRKLAQTSEPVIFVGKEGITKALIEAADQVLEARELVKGSVQQNSNSDVSAKEACTELCSALKAEGISVVGRKFVIYRQSEDKKISI